MRVLITGAEGLLGREVAKQFNLSGENDVFALPKKEFDITNHSAVYVSFKRYSPDLVINTAAFTNVDSAEENRMLAFDINAIGPLFLAESCYENKSIFVHISTDYVFSGNDCGNDENSKIFEPVNHYGFTKLLGEKLIKEFPQEYYVIRTSALFGSGGKNFLSQAYEIAKRNKELRIVDDQKRNPTYVKDLVSFLMRIKEFSAGVYHYTNYGQCSPAEFVEEIVRQESLDCRILRITSNQTNDKAKRPVSSNLINTKLPNSRRWQDALKAYLNELKQS